MNFSLDVSFVLLYFNKEHLFFIMQTLKPEIKAAILSSAEAIFYKNGYKLTTTRQIADSAGISVSNLYLYFKNKEHIFTEIVKPFYRSFTNGIKIFMNHADDDKSIEKRVYQIADMFSKIIISDRKRFIILFDKSGGTPFEKSKNNFIQIVATHIQKEVKSKLKNEIINIIASNLINSIIAIAKLDETEKDLIDNIMSVIEYHVNGIKYYV
jgi:AcrR family transcriptional regulator